MNEIAFEKALHFTLGEEGGFADDPTDHGGRTMEGITQATDDSYRQSQGLTPIDVKDVTPDEVRVIYLKQFWIPAQCDDMSLPLAICHFDWAVQHDVKRAIENLQQTMNLHIDGIYGINTRKALAILDHDDLWKEYNQNRREHYKAIVANNPTQQKFIKGWLGRVDRLDAYVENL